MNAQERKVIIIGLLSLFAAVVTYGLLSSTGAFNNNAWNLGGAIVGFLASVFSLNRVYGKGFLKAEKDTTNAIQQNESNTDASAILIEGKDEINNAMIQIVLKAKTYLYTIGGRSRNETYLNALKKKIMQTDIHYIRIITGDHIRHSLCNHLQDLLERANLGYYEEDRFGNVLVTHDTTFIALPSPEVSILDKGLVIYGSRIAADYRSFITELLGGSPKDLIIDSNFIKKLCRECRENR